MFKIFSSPSVICIAFFWIGCTSTTTTPPPTPTIVIPTTGTTWTFRNIVRDSNGTVLRTDTSTRLVAETNKTYGGYADVVMLIETFPKRNLSDTAYVRFLSTGDISRATATTIVIPGFPAWVDVPYYTQATHSASLDTNFTGSRGLEEDTISVSDMYFGQETDTVKSIPLDASVISATTSEHIIYAGTDSSNSIKQFNSLIRSKGIFGNHRASVHTIKGKRVALQESTLIDYNLK